MKNNKVLLGIIGFVALAIVDVIIYLCVKEYTIARWINIAGLNLAIIIFGISGVMTSNQSERFMEYSRFPIVAIYSGLTFIISALFILIGITNIPLSIIVQIVLLGIFIIAMSTNKMANNASSNVINEDKTNYHKIEDMSKRIETIMNMVNDRDIYKKIEKTYDSVKNAKVTLKGDSTQIDNDIMQAIGVLDATVQSKNFDMIDQQLNTINGLIAKRNQI